MIPLKIHLKNFLSYGPELQVIDFSDYALICLSGKNGHGKSALLDAITWALWGQARKVAGVVRADEGIMRLGQTHMIVILDFSFNEQTYRVRRELTKMYGKSQVVLEFGLLDQERDAIIPLTDKTIRLTQHKIEQLLNLDAESFCNSAFLRQGHANEFSKKSPKDRKIILASILGLNRYDTIRSLATEKAKAALAQKQHLTVVQEKCEQELSKVAQIDQEINRTQTMLQELNAHNEQIKQTFKLLAQEKQQLARQEQAVQLLLFEKNQRLQEQATKQTNLRSAFALWRKINAQCIQTVEVAALTSEQRSLITRVQEHQRLFQASLALKERLLLAQSHHAQQKQKLVATIAEQLQVKKIHIERLHAEGNATRSKLAEIAREQTAHAEKIIVSRQQKIALDAAIAQARSTVATYVHQEALFERRKEYYQKFTAQGTLLVQELDTIRNKQKFVHDDTNPSCPLCEQNLSATRKKMLKKHFSDNELSLQHRIGRLKKVATALKAILVEQHAQLTQGKKQLEELSTLTAQQGALEQQLQLLDQQRMAYAGAYEQCATMLTNHEQALKGEQQILAQETQQQETIYETDPLYQELSTTVQTMQRELETIAYNAGAHRTDHERLHSIESQLAQGALNQQELGAQYERAKQIQELGKELKQLKVIGTDLDTAIALHNGIPEQNKALQIKEEHQHEQENRVRADKEKLLQEQAALHHESSRLKTVELEYTQHQKTIAHLTTVIDDYQIISAATSKDGIQALLIEEAIPEIEQEANELLGKLTNNQAQLFIESLRDLKKGGSKETLDINIADSVGIRPYELFSGGEAFRIDFALRIAISKLLARRAGTSLQTLIIDEGFGSQDEEGLNQIMEALYAIQDDFAKIIIVSHLPFMKDQFPVHFVVEKGPQGSVVKVLELG